MDIKQIDLSSSECETKCTEAQYNQHILSHHFIRFRVVFHFEFLSLD